MKEGFEVLKEGFEVFVQRYKYMHIYLWTALRIRDLRKADKARIPAFAGTDFTPLERRKTRFSRGKQILFGHEKAQKSQR